MKILYPDCVDSVVGGSYDSNYPDVNVMDNHPQKKWMATEDVVDEDILIITTNDPINGIGIFNTNAHTVEIVVQNEAEDTTYETFNLTNTYQRFAAIFAQEYNEILHIQINLVADETVYVGVIKCGYFYDFIDPDYGLQQKREDYSVKEQLSNGGLYVYNRNKPRSYDISIVCLRTNASIIDNIFEMNGSLPLAMIVASNLNEDDLWSGFFHILDPPEIKHIMPLHSSVDFSIQEAI